MWGEWAFHMRAQIFPVRLSLSSHTPTPPCDLNHVSSDLILQIGHSSPSSLFERGSQIRGGWRDKGKNSAASERNSCTSFSKFFAFPWKLSHSCAELMLEFKACRAVGRLISPCRDHLTATRLPVLICCLGFFTKVKGKISVCNILLYFNDLLSLWGALVGWRR